TSLSARKEDKWRAELVRLGLLAGHETSGMHRLLRYRVRDRARAGRRNGVGICPSAGVRGRRAGGLGELGGTSRLDELRRSHLCVRVLDDPGELVPVAAVVE